MFYFIIGFFIGEILVYSWFKTKYSKNRRDNIRDYKNEIEKLISESRKNGYKIYFRTPDCDIFLEATLNIALEDNLENGREEVLIIDLD